MIVSRGGGEVIAAGPTGLLRYLPLSLLVTGVVAGVPLWVVLGPARGLGLLASGISVGLSFALGHLGARLWKKWPGSRDVVFNDLMLWGYCRRVITQRRVTRRVERLRLTATEGTEALTVAERIVLLTKLAVALETGDPYTHGHSQRVARHAYLVAKEMRLTRQEADKIRLAAVIHDIGKLWTPRAIVTKPGRLTDAEFDLIKQHAAIGSAIVEHLGDPDVTDMVRHHHERLDGSGYPDKLSGDEISIGARVLAVTDTFDAFSSLRPYRPAQKHQGALELLRNEADAGRLDRVVVDAFIRYYSGRRALSWWAWLSSGPAHVADLFFSSAQRLGTASLVNTAIVAVTATALAPTAPLHGAGLNPDGRVARRTTTVAVEERHHRQPRPEESSVTTPRHDPPDTTEVRRKRVVVGSVGGRTNDGVHLEHGKGPPDRAGNSHASPGIHGNDKEPKVKDGDTTIPDAHGRSDDAPGRNDLAISDATSPVANGVTGAGFGHVKDHDHPMAPADRPTSAEDSVAK